MYNSLGMLDVWIFICVYLEINIHRHKHASMYVGERHWLLKSLEICFAAVNPILFHVVSFPGLVYQYKTIKNRIE